MKTRAAWTMLLSATVMLSILSSASSVSFDSSTGQLKDVLVKVSDRLPMEQCSEIIKNIKVSLVSMSESMYLSLDRRIYYGEISIQVPSSWSQSHCGDSIVETYHNQDADILVTTGFDGSYPYTQQSSGCSKPGDKLILPYSYLLHNSTDSGRILSNLWIRLRYGVFEDLDSSLDPTSRHYAQCMGRSAREIVNQHQDFSSLPTETNFTQPRITLVKKSLPKFVILLENSVKMNLKGEWEYIRTACRKFIHYDLPDEVALGLVLFNDEAHIAHPIGRLSTNTRNGLAFSIPNKHNLSPRNGSCVSCAVTKAIEALQSSGVPRGGVIIIITRGNFSFGSTREEEDTLKVSLKHNLHLFPVQVQKEPNLDDAAPLDRLAHQTGSPSFHIEDRSVSENPSPSIYMDLVDSLRTIIERTVPYSAQLMFERRYEPGDISRVVEEGSFIIDRFAGQNTRFNVYFPEDKESYIKSVSVSDTRTNSYSTVMDTTQILHFYSLYNVPFDNVENTGMRWNYSLVRLPSLNLENRHIVQVTSAPSLSQGSLQIELRSNLEQFESNLSPDNPVILYAQVHLNQRPVLNARVVADIQGTNRAGFPVPRTNLLLLDSGTGNPDILSGDGVYSRFFTKVQEEGRYTFSLHVSSSSQAPAWMETRSGEREYLGEFSRISDGFSFRVSSLKRGYTDSLPPSRVLDLSVNTVTASQQLEFSWTAPGDDYDDGKPSSYQIFYTEDPSSFYKNRSHQLVESFSGGVSAGGRETHTLNIQEYNKDLYYSIVAVDDEGNVGDMSNIVRAYMPQPYMVQDTSQSLSKNVQLREGLFNPFEVIREPNKVILYVVVGVVTVVIFTFLIVMMIMILSRKLWRKEQENDDLSVHRDYGVNDNDLLKYNKCNVINNEYETQTKSIYCEEMTSCPSIDNIYTQAGYTANSMETFKDPYSKSLDPIYSKPVPKTQRTHSPVKSILKKVRGDGDGESETNIYVSRFGLSKPYLVPDITQHGGGQEAARPSPDVVQTGWVSTQV